MTMTHEQRIRWTHRHCRFAVANRVASLIAQRLTLAGVRQLTGLQLLHIILEASQPYTRELTDQQRYDLLSSIVEIAEQLRGRVSVLDVRLKLPKLLHRLRIPMTFMKSPEVSALIEEAIETLRLRGRRVEPSRPQRERDWEAVRHISDPLRFQPKPVAQEF